MRAPTVVTSIDALLEVDPRLLDAAELKAHVVELGRARARMDAAEAAAVAEFDQRGCWTIAGMPSCAVRPYQIPRSRLPG